MKQELKQAKLVKQDDMSRPFTLAQVKVHFKQATYENKERRKLDEYKSRVRIFVTKMGHF